MEFFETESSGALNSISVYRFKVSEVGSVDDEDSRMCTRRNDGGHLSGAVA